MTFRELLKASDCTASRLARALGVSRTIVSYWADGRSVPSVVTAARIADVLNVPIEKVVKCFE